VSNKCALTGKKPVTGSKISHAHNVTNRWFHPNLQSKRIFIPELDRWVRLRVSTSALRTINKKGLLSFLRDEGLSLAQVTH
jgi:large subunit ribosomal protein L28